MTLTLVATLILSGCQATQRQNATTGQDETNSTTQGAIIGAIAGAAIGLATGDNAKERRNQALIGAAGGAAVISPGYVGICDANPEININKLPFSQRLKFLLSPKGQPLLQRFLYYSRHGGIFWPFLFLLPYLRLLRF